MSYNKQKLFTIKIAKRAGKELMKYFKIVEMQHATSKQKNKRGSAPSLPEHKKNKHEIVTPADLTSNKIITNAIKKKFKSHGILSEETGWYQKDADYVWIIDPLDGTTNFSLGNPFFNVSIALVHKGKIVVGVVYAPYLKQLFVAEKGKGATMNNKKIKVSRENKIENAVIDFGYSYKDVANKKFLNVYTELIINFEHTRNMGAAALEMAWVAMGRMEGYFHFDVHLWDVAAGILMIREAGGEVTDANGKPVGLKTKTLIGSNKTIHDKLIKVVDRGKRKV